MDRKLRESFRATEALAEATAALELYLEQTSERESERVLLAILKLADGRESELLTLVETALIDYRDVLAWAEYPEQMRLPPGVPASTLEAVRARDRAQYLRWLGEDG